MNFWTNSITTLCHNVFCNHDILLIKQLLSAIIICDTIITVFIRWCFFYLLHFDDISTFSPLLEHQTSI